MRLFFTRVVALLQRRRLRADLSEEIDAHLELAIAEHIGRGLSPEDARRAALRSFGGVLQTEETFRERLGFPLLDSMWQDIRYAARSMRRSPTFAAIAILTLALGVGATISIFSIVHSLLIRPLPFPDAHRLVAVFATSATDGARDSTSFLDFSDWQRQARAFTTMAAYRSERFNITGDGPPEPVGGIRASHELFTVLGVNPLLGRPFNQEEQHGQRAVALISHGLWTRRYGSDPAILGRSILINEVSHVVIGVLPVGFQFPPFIATNVVAPIPERPSRSTGYLFGIGRLNSSSRIETARQELTTIARRLEAAFPASNRGRGARVVRLQEQAASGVRVALLSLLGAAVLVLLIGCANVGNLVLARGIARQRELAVRRAMGAGRARLVRQLLTESVSLGFVAVAVGGLLAFWGSRFLAAALAQRYPLPDITFSWSLLLAALALALLAGVVSGLPAAVMVWRSGLNDALKQDGRSQSAGMREQRLGQWLIVAETALTVTLLIGAGLLVKSFIRLQQIDVGVNPQQSLTANLLLSKRYVTPERRAWFVQQLQESVARVPGVLAAGVHTDPPFLGGGSRETFTVENQPDPRPDQGHPAGFDIMTGPVFRALGMTIVRGRDFDAHDVGSSGPVAIVNETFARRFWPDGQDLGKRVRLYYDRDRQHWWSIVGVVRDVRYRGRLFDPVPQMFVPSDQQPYRSLPYQQSPFVYLIVRMVGNPADAVHAVQAAIWAVDKDQPVWNLHPMDRPLWEAAAVQRISMTLLAGFASIALAIACAGIYGLSAYAVVRRRQELGIRLAIGATPRQLLALLVGQGMLLSVLGAGIGLAGALALAKLISGFLYGITATDVPTFAVVLALFSGVAFVATYLPARRATAIDPSEAFRTN